MPPKFKFSKDEIINAAADIVREQGVGAVTARAVGAKLLSSPKVIFGHFDSMDELLSEVIHYAERLYMKYIEEDMKSGKYPPYKASGMGYIRFAKEESELFKLLFMRDRTREALEFDDSGIEWIIDILKSTMGMTDSEARLFHFEMWVYVHGIAVMLVTSYLPITDELIEKTMTDVYEGAKKRYLTKKGNLNA